MSEKERSNLIQLVFDLTYSAISKSFHMSKTDIVDAILFNSNPDLTRVYFCLVDAGMTRYGLVENSRTPVTQA